MNYRGDIEKAIDYIEKNIKTNIRVEEIAKQSGYSLYHFSRVFTLCKDMSIMEYVRMRKLSRAALELLDGKKIIDISIEYGFETHGGFAKAFRKQFGYSPTTYMLRMYGYKDTKEKIKIGGYIMNPKIVKKPAFKVVGYGIETDVSGDSYTKDISAFWTNYEGENLESKLYQILNPEKHGEIGICKPVSDSGKALYLLGVVVKDYRSMEKNMLSIEVPEAEYAVFTTPPIDTRYDQNQQAFADIIKSTWRYIFEEWFEQSGYIYDSNKLDFEFYDERCHYRKDTVMEIYIPIKKL